MSKDLFIQVTVAYAKDILADAQNAVLKSVVMGSGSGTVPLGAVLYKNAESQWQPAASANIVAGTELAIAMEPVETGDIAGGDGIAASALFAGVVVGENLTLTDEAALTDAMLLVLRGQGIHTKAAM